jgi:cytoskeletal protein RodZ
MTLGSLIAQARKSAGLSVEDLSEATNIRGGLLREMESDNFKNCGGETYTRGHLRNIAIKLGVEPQVFLVAFEDEQMQADRSIKEMLVESNVMKKPEEPRKVSWKVLATISVASLFVVGLAQIVISNTASVDIPEPIASVSATPSETAETAPVATEQTPTEQATVSTGTGVTLIVSAERANSWLFVSDASGRTLFSGQIARGVTKTFSTDVSLNLKVGNAGGVDLTVNGNKVDSIGGDGEVVSVSYGVDS